MDGLNEDEIEEGHRFDVYEPIRVLYNMAITCMCDNNFDLACEYMVAVVKNMEYMNVFDLFVCDLAKIYGMTAYCYYKKNMIYIFD